MPSIRRKTTGIIRPGQKTPYHRSTEDQIDQMLDTVQELVDRRFRKGKIHAYMLEKFGIQWRQTENYVARARARQLLHIRQTKEVLRSGSAAFYLSKMETATSERDQLFAAERYDKLLGLELMKSIGIGGIEDAPPVKMEVTVKEKRRDPRLLPVAKLLLLRELIHEATIKKENGSAKARH